MKLHQTLKFKVHGAGWPVLVGLAALGCPCRAVGTFVVLDLTMASPAAFMWALLSMWKVITNICGSVGHLCLWVCIARTPCSWGRGH